MNSVAFGEALAAELPAFLGRANAIAPNKVQNGSARDGDEGGGTSRRQRAHEALQRLAALWSQGARGRKIALVWWLFFVRAGADERARWEGGKTGAYARRVYLLTLERGERTELLSHATGPDAAAARCAGVGLIAWAEGAFAEAMPIASGGAWLNELVALADRAAQELRQDEGRAAVLRAQRKAARRERAA